MQVLEDDSAAPAAGSEEDGVGLQLIGPVYPLRVRWSGLELLGLIHPGVLPEKFCWV